MFPGATIGPAGHESGSKAKQQPGGAWCNLGRAASALGLLLVALNSVGGCGSNKNYEQREAFASTLPDDGKAGVFADEIDGCLGQCQRDPGSPLMDCAAEETGYEFLSLWNFDGALANYMYTYTDNSVQNLNPRGWEPATAGIARCIGATDEQGFHLTGGPFRDWGGGFGMRLDWRLAGLGNCTDPNYREDFCAPIGSEYPFDLFTFDLTQWDGISFWARRGPDGQPLLRVMIGDRRTDDDISFLMYEADPNKPRFCERNLVCGCPLGLSCNPLPAGVTGLDTDCPLEGMYVCSDPELDPNLTKFQTYQVCGQSACNCPYDAFPTFEDTGEVRPDPQYTGDSCSEFAFRGGIVDDFCYKPGQDPNPSEGSDLCGDHWTYPVHLTTDWQFFKVPFTRLLQQGWAKEQHEFDLQAISMIRFSWDKGFIDYWIDDVGFYREQRPE